MITFATEFDFDLLTVNFVDMDIVNRLKQYMDYVGLQSTQFADKAEIARPTLSQILNGRNRKISNELLDKLHKAYPTLNIMWLLFGDGDIELNANKQISEPQNTPNLFDSAPETTNYQPEAFELPQQKAQQFSLRNSNIEEFVEDNIQRNAQRCENQSQVTANLSQIAAKTNDSSKKIKTIMVFYNDSSYEIFSPAIP